ncbi:hypothetical protein TSAR_008730 [Trichomalopsis sarcophagae]|uniref:Uncharacterized protein n=1 Tax=Trichomalopsis sarcophagae TaxID=543379 RepID=A0A232EW97_9HYME|nr:hypothetical protein TSAR_008730 [Trichomalopsis sarcophagae]
MKLYAVVSLLVLLAIHNAESGSWQGDIQKTRLVKLYGFIVKESQMIQSNAVITNTPNAWNCAYAAYPQLTNLLPAYSQEIDKCLKSTTNENDGNRCCDPVDYNTIIKAVAITNNAMKC